MTRIPDEARKAAHDAAIDRWLTGSSDTTQMLLSVDAALLAALPHLEGATPAIDREALRVVLEAHRMHYAYGTATACLCGWIPPDVWAWQADHREHIADAVIALIGGAS